MSEQKKERPAASLDFTPRSEVEKKKADNTHKVQRVRGLAVWKNKFGYSVTLSGPESGAAILAWLRNPAKFQEDYFINLNTNDSKGEQKAADFAANYTSAEIESTFNSMATEGATDEESPF